NPADLPAPVFTGDITAYDYYLQARDYLRRPHTTENLDNATQLFERALSRDERFARAEAGLCEALWWKYDLTRDTNPADAAEQACRRALALSEKLPEVYVALGNIYQGTGRLDDSVNAYRRAIELDPKNDAAFRGLAFAFEQAGNAGQAEATYRHAIDLQPGYWRGHFWLANFLVGHGRFSEALGSYRQAINLTPDNLQVYENLGGVLFFTGRFEEAIQALEKALELRPTARAYSNLGTVYYYAGRFTDSRDQFLRALELAPDDYRWWHNLGDVYRQLGNSKSAESYTRALQLGRKRLDINPQDGFAWKVLSLVLARLGQEEEARRALESAMKYSPNDVDLDFQRALVFEALGEREAALAALEKAIRGGQSAAIVRGDPDIADLIRSPRIRELISESE
ncbi:MAG: tetratricopeptide repeat protein, partial [Gammaproteobacteria bacterium]|nr:tetratricopeptide repeat protein [Gammaproteobacteria bacterium]